MNDQFLRTFFSLIMGWTRDIIAWFWQVFGQKGEEGFQNWFQQNWIKLVLTVCIVCAVTDLLVYLFRWRPMRVWATFFRRVFRRNETETLGETQSNDVNPQTTRNTLPNESASHRFREFPERSGYPDAAGYASGTGRYSEDTSVSEREFYAGRQSSVFHEESERRTPERDGTQSEENSRRDRIEAIRHTRKRFQWSEILGTDEVNGNDIAYRRPEPAFDKQDAYREPVYPDQWSKRENPRRGK